MRKLFLIAAMAVVLALASISQADELEKKEQVTLKFKSTRPLTDKVDFTATMAFINLITNYAPYTDVSLYFKINSYFSTGVTVGYGAEVLEEMRGGYYGMDLDFSYKGWKLENNFTYYEGLDVAFSGHSLSHPIGFMAISLDDLNFHYLKEEEKYLRSYRVGPGLKIPFSKNLDLKLNVFYAFEPYGNDDLKVKQEDAILYRTTLTLKF